MVLTTFLSALILRLKRWGSSIRSIVYLRSRWSSSRRSRRSWLKMETQRSMRCSSSRRDGWLSLRSRWSMRNSCCSSLTWRVPQSWTTQQLWQLQLSGRRSFSRDGTRSWWSKKCRTRRRSSEWPQSQLPSKCTSNAISSGLSQERCQTENKITGPSCSR